MIVFSNIHRLYDGSGSDDAAVQTQVDVWIDGQKIKKVTPHDASLRQSEQLQLIDASSFTVTPGIIDCHGHITVLGLRSADIERMNNSQEALLLVEKILYASLVEGGVTTMRDIGGATHFMKRMVEEGIMLGPRLKIAICMLSTTGGHADFRGPDRCHAELSKLWPEGPGRPSSIVDGPWECRKRVREIAACGADLIKICASPGVASPSDQLDHREFTAAEIAAICDEAQARGLRVAAHAHSQSGIQLAIENGVSDIQHISFMNEEQVELAYARGCTVTPTSWVVQSLIESEELSPFVMEKAKRAHEHHSLAVEYAHKGGLKILAGTDPVIPGMHGRNFMEIVALMRDGLSSLQAWHAATGLAAEGLGQTDAGTLKPGQRADLLIAKDDIISDPSRLDRGALVEVIKDGEGYRGFLQELPQRTFHQGVRQALGI